MASKGFAKGDFIWSAGIEDTCVYPSAQYEMSPLDEFLLTDHDLNWKSDLHALRDIGATAVRYGVNWPLSHTGQYSIDWTTLDERLNYAADNLGLIVIADLVHYGTPSWLKDSFADARYPAAISYFAAEFAKRYKGTVDHITPMNEPLTTASFCGLRGIWPPAIHGWEGWTKVVVSIALGMSQSIAAIREVNPDARIVHVEASSIYLTNDRELDAEIPFLEAIALLPTDLLFGFVDESHTLFAWLIEHGALESDLNSLRENVQKIDLLGVNYYPDLTPRFLQKSDSGIEQVAINLGGAGLAQCLRKFATRYNLPLIIGETSIEGSDSIKIDWVNDSVNVIQSLRQEGLDLRGYTWWPLFDFVDWSYASSGRNLEEFLVHSEILASRQKALHEAEGEKGAGKRKTPFLRRMGLVHLDEQEDGSLVRILTGAAGHVQSIIREAQEDSKVAPPSPVFSGYFADPFVIDTPVGFVAFGTTVTESGTKHSIKAISSTNLVDWQELESVLIGVPAELGSDFWAPEVVYAENSYWMYFSVGTGDVGHHIRVAKSDSPLGPFLDQGVNLTPNEAFAIDAHPFQDDDGSWFLYFARDVLNSKRVGTHLAAARMLSMTQLEPSTIEILAPNADWQIYERGRHIYDQVVDWHTLEGPSIVKHAGKYLLFFSGGNWQNESYGVSYASADSPLGPWKHESTWNAITLNSSSSGLIGPGHCSFLQLDPLTDLIVYHAWNEDRTMRQLYINELDWITGLPVVSKRGLHNPISADSAPPGAIFTN